MEPRLNVITLAVEDLERALVFYRDGLGLQTTGVVATDLVDEKTGAAGAIVIFKLESGLILALYPRTELAKDAAVPAGPSQIGEFSLGQLVASRADVDRILEQAAAAGGIATPATITAVLAAGASAAQVGSALMLTPEAGTSEAHRAAFSDDAPTDLTRAFTGRRGRGIVNRFMREYGGLAPKAYPHVHYLTAPLRAAARAAGDRDVLNLWAGRAYRFAQPRPAAELISSWVEELGPRR